MSNKLYRVVVVADLEIPAEVEISEEGLQERRETVIVKWLENVKAGFGVMFDIAGEQVEPTEFNVYIGEVKDEKDELGEPEAEDRIEDSPQPALV